MQPVSAAFNNHAGGNVRPISFRVLISFSREFDDSLDFFTIGQSAIGGTDLLKGENDVIQDWDRYEYLDFSDRVLQVGWQRELDPFDSTALAMADLVLDNHDHLFSADNYIKPYRPIRVYAGFGGEMVQVFVGLTEKAPVIDEVSKTATYHCIDFLSQLFNRKIDRMVMLQDYRTDEVLAELLDLAGLLVTQYSLDTGFNIIPFAYFERDTTFGDAIRSLMVAEQGRFFLDENGVTTFKSRQGFNTTPIWTFSPYNVLAFDTSREDNIINSVVVKSNVRQVQGQQNIGELAQTVAIDPGETVDVWIDFQDPVTSADDPEAYATSTTSFWLASDTEDGSGNDVSSDLVLADSQLFAMALLLSLTNSGSSRAYVYKMQIFGTPARVVDRVNVSEIDQPSIDEFDERVKEIDNDFIQSITDAQSKALVLIDDYKDYADILSLDVKGNMAFQLGDYATIGVRPISYVVETGDTRATICASYGITETDLEALNPWLHGQVTAGQLLNLGYIQNSYMIDNIICTISPGKFSQQLRAVKKTFRTYMTIGVSEIGGIDAIAP